MTPNCANTISIMNKSCQGIPLKGKELRNLLKLRKAVAVYKTNNLSLSKKLPRGIIPLRWEVKKNCNAMSEKIGPEISVCKGDLSVDRNIILNYLSSPTSSSPVSVPTETANRRFMNFPFLQWKVFSLETHSLDNKIGCIKRRLEA